MAINFSNDDVNAAFQLEVGPVTIGADRPTPAIALDYSLAALGWTNATSTVQTHVRVRIPKSRHPEPVLSNLINHYGLKVNIQGALLGVNGKEDGWFDLELQGQAAQVRAALLDLLELDADIWLDTAADDGL